MAVYPSTFPDGVPYPVIPRGTTTVNVSTSAQLTAALSSAAAGHKIVLANGTYTGDFTISGKNGTASAGISVEAANVGSALIGSGSTWRINNSNFVTVSGLMWNWQGSGETFQVRGTSHHCRITRCTFGPTTHSESANVQTWVFVGDDAYHIRVDHCEIRNKGTSGNGVRVYGSFAKVDAGQGSSAGCRWVRIDHNIFRAIKPEVGNDKEPVRYGVSTMSRTIANGVIERNYFEDCICEPELISVKMGGIRTSGNTMVQCAGGPVIRHGTNSLLADNYVIDREATFGATIGSGGARFYDADHEVSRNYIDGVFGGNFQGPLLLDTGDAEGLSTNLNAHWRVIGAMVERNVIVGGPEGVRIGDNYSSVPRDCTIRDNLVVDVDTAAAVTQRVAPSNTVMTNNQYYASTSAAGMTEDAGGVWRKPGYGPRLTLLAAADVGPSGDTGDTDGTGAELVGGGGPDPDPVAVPADVLNIGDEPGQNHFQLQYAVDGSPGNDIDIIEFEDVAAGFAHDPYFKVVNSSGAGAQTLGVGGIATASGPNVTLTSADSTSTLVITTGGRVYDGQGHTVKKIDIQASNVTVQNFYVRGAGNAGIYSLGSNNVIQNCDIAQVTEGGEGDINGITFFGDGTKIRYNKIDNLVSGELNGSHTDGIQCWATPSKNSSSDVEIIGNWINGPVNSDERHIHQAIMAEGPDSTDGGGGGSGTSENWLVADNYFNSHGTNQCLKFDDIHDVVITRNIFAGESATMIELGSLSTGTIFYSDNTITGTYVSDGVSTTSGSGPATPGGSTTGGVPAVQFRVRADSATTSGSTEPRSELRETRANGDEMAFDALSGEHALHTRARITHLPSADPEVTVCQLHNGVTGDRINVRTQLVSSQIKLICRINGTQADPRFDESYSVGEEFEVLMRVRDGGVVEVYYNGATEPTCTGQLSASGAGASWYFKAGAYAAFNESSVSASEYVSVEHRDLWVTHSGARVDAGVDASVVKGQDFTRTALELGLTGITARRWTIVSRPNPPIPDPEQPPLDMTQAAIRHGWGTPHALSDEFDYTGPPNSTKWQLPGADWAGHSGNGRRRPERQTVAGGMLVMTGLANGDSGWCRHKLDVQYGRWEARVRSFAGAPSAGEPDSTSNGNDYHPLLLLWPESNSRQTDGEYDWMENGAPGENTLEAFIHYPHPGTEVVQQEHFERPGSSLSQFHNIAMEWTSQHIKGFFDGIEWFSVSGGANSVRRNIQTMPAGHAVVQLDNFDGTDQTPATIELQWFRYFPL